MVSHPEWGLPGTLYLDNGGEYNWSKFIDDAMQLGDMTVLQSIDKNARLSSIVKAMPYNAAAKPIEGLFGSLEQGVLSSIPGASLTICVCTAGADPPPPPPPPPKKLIFLSYPFF